MKRHSRFFTAWLAAAASVGLPSGAQAWGGDGHSLIMRVAYDGLPPDLQRRFDAIREAADIRHQYDHERRGRTVHEDCQADTLDELVNWADCVRYDDNTPRFAVTGAYHFDDLPFCGRPVKSRYCRDGECGTEALQRYVAVIRDRSSSDRDRLEALAFVVHIVGDLHQPLHTMDNRDSGGNGITVEFNNRETNLHSFWDSGLLRLAYENRDAGLRGTRELARENERAWSAIMAPDSWVRDTHRLADEAYRRLQRRPRCNQGSMNAGEITERYTERFVPVVRDQIGMAAVRLRNVLTYALR